MNYQTLLRKNNSSLYEAIKENIHEMPDFRPSETVNKMNKESQNNWKILCDELDAISYRKDHMAILEALNEGNNVDIDEYEVLREFVISYPGITWVLWTISDVILPLFISQWKNLPSVLSSLLEKIPMKTEYIAFLRDREGAKKFKNRIKEIDETILNRVIKEEYSKDLVGWSYWFMTYDLFSENFLITQWELFMIAIARLGDKRILFDVNEYMKENEFNIGIWHETFLLEGSIEQILHILSKGKQYNWFSLFISAIQLGRLDIIKHLRSIMPCTSSDLQIKEILQNALLTTNLLIIQLLFEDLVFSSHIKYIYPYFFVHIIVEDHQDIIAYLLSQPISDDIWKSLKDIAFTKRRNSIIEMIVNNKNIIWNDYDIKIAVAKNNVELVSIILNTSSYICGSYDISALRSAILSYNKSIVKILLFHPKMNIKKLEPRYLTMAEKLLQE